MTQKNTKLLQLPVDPLTIDNLKRYCLDNKLPSSRSFGADLFTKIFELVRSGKVTIGIEDGKATSLSWNGNKANTPKK